MERAKIVETLRALQHAATFDETMNAKLGMVCDTEQEIALRAEAIGTTVFELATTLKHTALRIKQHGLTERNAMLTDAGMETELLTDLFYMVTAEYGDKDTIKRAIADFENITVLQKLVVKVDIVQKAVFDTSTLIPRTAEMNAHAVLKLVPEKQHNAAFMAKLAATDDWTELAVLWTRELGITGDELANALDTITLVSGWDRHEVLRKLHTLLFNMNDDGSLTVRNIDDSVVH